MSDQNKLIKMQLEDHSSSDSQKLVTKQAKEESQDQAAELALEEWAEDISIDIVDGIVNVTMPEPVFMLIKSLISKLNINIINEEELKK